MKVKFLLLAILLGLSLAGCSNVLPAGALLLGEEKPNSPVPEPAAPRFEPQEKPSHPAASEDIHKILKDLKQASTWIPEDPAFMRAIIVGDKVRDIFRGSQERNQALQKLTSEGLAFLARIARDCQLAPATRKDSGVARPGNTSKSVLSMSGQGAHCEYPFSKTLEKNVTASPGTQDPNTGVYRWTESVSLTYREQRDVLNPRIQSLSNILLMERVYQTSGALDLAASAKGYDIAGKFRSTGRVKIQFTQGEVLAGSFYSESETRDNKTTTSLRFEGKIASGDVLIIALREAGTKTSPGTMRLFINGEPAPADILSFFGLELMEAVSTRE